MEQPFEMIAKTFQGLEEVLAQELTAIGAENVEIGNRMVKFTGDKRLLYKANFCLRTAVRVLKAMKHFTATSADEVYEQVKDFPWEEILDVNKTFAVDSVVYSSVFRHSMFVSYKVKDAIADYFREKTGQRPNVSLRNPDILLNIHISETDCTLSLDSSGESLHRRGYRQATLEAPLNEALAAGIIMLAGWNGQCDLIDPMCGSGTIPIEAYLIARNIAPGVFRTGYAFEKWADYDQELFNEVYNDDSSERPFEHKIYAYDNDPRAINVASHNIKAAGAAKDIELKLQAFQQFEQPAEKAIIITNPPYGERISSDDLLGLYKAIGERLKHAFTGNQAWILSYRDECFDQIGLKPTQKILLKNGELDCQYREYELFDGKYRMFRESGEELEKRREERPRKTYERKFRKADDERTGNAPSENEYERAHQQFQEWERLQARATARRTERKEYTRDEKPYDKDNRFKERRDDRPGRSWQERDGHPRSNRPRDDRPRDGWQRDNRFKDSRPRRESYPERKRREQRERQGNDYKGNYRKNEDKKR